MDALCQEATQGAGLGARNRAASRTRALAQKEQRLESAGRSNQERGT